MYSKITQRRWLGLKRDDNEVANDPGVYATVTMSYANGYRCLHAQKHHITNETGRALPTLWAAECVGKGPYSELWRGFQRTKLPHGLGVTTCIQEWYVEHIDMRPPLES